MRNQNLLQITLLGTAKKNLNNDTLVPILQPAVAHSPDPETALLDALTATELYEQAAWCGDQLNIPHLSIALPEILQYAPNKANDLLLKLLNDDEFRQYSDIIELMLQKYIERQWLIPIVLLDLMANWVGKIQLHLLLPVIGERGKWLWKIKAEMGNLELEKYLDKTNAETMLLDEKNWQESNATDRKNAFKQCREQQPNLAREWLMATWDKENVNDKIAFLKIMAIRPHKEDLPFLSNILADINAIEKTKLKPKQHELRQVVTNSMARIPESETHQALCKAVLACWKIKEKKHLLLLKKTEIELQIPTLSGFWQPDNLQQQYGLDNPKNTSDSLNIAAYYLTTLLQYVPPIKWREVLNIDAKQVIHYFLIEGKDPFLKEFVGEIFASLQMATLYYQDAEFAQYLVEIALTKEKFQPHIQAEVFQILSPQNRINILQNMGWARNDHLYHLLLSLPRCQTWDRLFGLAMLQQLEICKQFHYQTPKEILSLYAQNLSYQSLKEFYDDIEERINQNSDNNNNYTIKYFRDYTLNTLFKLYNIVQEIKSI